jgi:hypothetical protein
MANVAGRGRGSVYDTPTVAHDLCKVDGCTNGNSVTRLHAGVPGAESVQTGPAMCHVVLGADG